jgi:hypothetical protein
MAITSIAAVSVGLTLGGCGLLQKKDANAGSGQSTPVVSTGTPQVPDSAPATPAPSDTAAIPDPCTLLTDADVSAISGSQISGHNNHASNAIPECSWDSDRGWLRLMLSSTTKDAFHGASTSDSDSKPVAGFGDEAFVKDSDMSFRHDTLWVKISWVGFTGSADARLAAEKKVAAKILGNLK